MKILTERIRVEKSTDIPSTSRFLFYDEKLKLSKKVDKRYRIKEELMAELNKNSNLDEDIKKYIDEKLEEIINA